jgi:transcriptional regulator GlxA family with amidase domain
MSKRIGFFIFDGLTALDLVGPFDTFAVATELASSRENGRAYDLVTVGLNKKAVVAESGMTFRPDTTIFKAPALDTLIIPGGEGLRRANVAAKVSDWLRRRASNIRRLVSICTGVYGLAYAGLLDGRRVSTHWRFVSRLTREFPKLKIEPDALFVKDGPFYTSAGIAAGIDLCLALIEEDYGPKLALDAARELVVYLKRPGDQEQYSQALQFQVRSTDRFSEIVAWIAGHLSEDLSQEVLASKAAYSPRHFGRLFRNTYGMTPARFVERLRMDEARARLARPRSTVQNVAESVGFKNRFVFSRAFQRRFGLSPNAYRQNFQSPPKAS